MPSNHLILCHPLLLLSSIFPSIRVFSSESALCISWPKHWSFSFSVTSPKLFFECFKYLQKKLKKKAQSSLRKHLKHYHYFIDGETEASRYEVISPKIADSAKGRVHLANAHCTTLAHTAHETVIPWLRYRFPLIVTLGKQALLELPFDSSTFRLIWEKIPLVRETILAPPHSIKITSSSSEVIQQRHQRSLHQNRTAHCLLSALSFPSSQTGPLLQMALWHQLLFQTPSSHATSHCYIMRLSWPHWPFPLCVSWWFWRNPHNHCLVSRASSCSTLLVLGVLLGS